MHIVRWLIGLAMAGLLLVAPYFYYRWGFEQTRRLRVVMPGVLYRSGRLTAEGLEQTVQKYQIKTVVNLWNSRPDPVLDDGRRESELCRERGVQHVYLPVELVHPLPKTAEQPATIRKFLAIMDDAANHPVLIHCRAGVHRAGIHSALFRMEYNRWSRLRAFMELQDMGFGESECHDRNLYVAQYVLDYEPRWKTSRQQSAISTQHSALSTADR